MEGVPFAPEVRMIRINGSTFPAAGGGSPEEMPAPRRQRRTRKQEGGKNPIDDVVPASPSMIGQPIIPTGQVFINKVNEVAVLPTPAQQKGGNAIPTNVPPGPVLPSGGGGHTKVVLNKKTSVKTKVLLKKKLMVQQPAKSASKTSGKSRKITVKHVGNKIRKTRHAVKHAKELPIDKLRAHLIEKKLIKPNSKAPESILRQIYADSLIVSKKTL